MRQKARRLADVEYLQDVFTHLLLLNEERGFHATGAAILGRDGAATYFKTAIAADQFILKPEYDQVLSRFDASTLALIGHTRWATRGNPNVNRNNHPILAQHVLGTHNGTIENADALFKQWSLPRVGTVDSELLFRLADTYASPRGLDVVSYLRALQQCRGAMSAVVLNTLCPHEILIMKGNRPLHFRWHGGLAALAYASDDAYLDFACDVSEGWVQYPVAEMTAMIIRLAEKFSVQFVPLAFTATEPISNHIDDWGGYGGGWKRETDGSYIKRSTPKPLYTASSAKAAEFKAKFSAPSSAT
jgi:amidophosphoribosyltransferase